MNANEHNNPPAPPFMPVDPEILNILKPGNRVMVSYPRTGSNWLTRAIHALIKHELQSITDSPEDLQRLPDLYKIISSGIDLHKINGSKLIKTHSWDGLPASRIVYVTRRLEDIMISYWMFAKNTGHLDETISMDTFIKGNAANAVIHHKRLLDECRAGRHRITVTSYERMQNDQIGELRRAARGLDIPVSDVALDAAINDSKWDQMVKSFKQPAVMWRGRSGSGAEILPNDLLTWLREVESEYLPAVELLLDQDRQ